MRRVFVSYNNIDRPRTVDVVRDLEAAGYEAWFDQDLTGGQEWWDVILEQIRTCDALVVAVTENSLDSAACRAEWQYAVELGKAIVPLQLEDTSIDLAPSSLQHRQWVDYRSADKQAAFSLVKAVNSAACTVAALPDPLPVPPALPLTYVAELRQQLDSAAPLTLQQQLTIVFQLRERPPRRRRCPQHRAAPPALQGPGRPARRGRTRCRPAPDRDPRPHRHRRIRRSPPAATDRAPAASSSVVAAAPAPMAMAAETVAAVAAMRRWRPRWRRRRRIDAVAVVAATSLVHPRRRRAAAILAAVVIGVVALGGDDDGEAGSTTVAESSDTSLADVTTSSVESSPTTAPSEAAAALCDPAAGERCIVIDATSRDGDALMIEWTALGFDPSVDEFHAHFFLSDITAAQAGNNAADFGFEPGYWELTDEQPYHTTTLLDAASGGPWLVDFDGLGFVPGLCVTVGTAPFHNVLNPNLFTCTPFPA